MPPENQIVCIPEPEGISLRHSTTCQLNYQFRRLRFSRSRAGSRIRLLKNDTGWRSTKRAHMPKAGRPVSQGNSQPMQWQADGAS